MAIYVQGETKYHVFESVTLVSLYNIVMAVYVQGCTKYHVLECLPLSDLYSTVMAVYVQGGISASVESGAAHSCFPCQPCRLYRNLLRTISPRIADPLSLILGCWHNLQQVNGKIIHILIALETVKISSLSFSNGREILKINRNNTEQEWASLWPEFHY